MFIAKVQILLLQVNSGVRLLKQKPTCSLCKNKRDENTFVWVEKELFHKFCYMQSHQKEMEALREVRKQTRLKAKQATVVNVDTLRVRAIS